MLEKSPSSRFWRVGGTVLISPHSNSRAGITTGNLACSLTQRTTCGLVKSTSTYQSPSTVVDFCVVTATSKGSRISSFHVPRITTMALVQANGSRSPAAARQPNRGRRVQPAVRVRRQPRQSGRPQNERTSRMRSCRQPAGSGDGVRNQPQAGSACEPIRAAPMNDRTPVPATGTT